MSSRTRYLRALAAVALAALIAGSGAPALAQSAPPTTVNPLEDLVQKLLGGGTTVPPPPPAAGEPGSDPAAAPSDAGQAPPAAPGDGSPPPDADHVVPPDAQVMIDSISRTGGRSSNALVAALHQLTALGLSAEEAAVIGMGHFPIAGEAAYNDDFLMPRFTPSFHTHQGNDIFAADGAPIRAPMDGTVRFSEDAVSGKAVYLTTNDGTFYFGCHLSGYADLPDGPNVTQGTIIGYNGNTGNAQGGTPHLHFEIHPGGGAATNPKPILDGWLDEALANVSALVASYQQVGLPKPISYAGVLRRFDEPLAGGDGVSALLTASASNPGIRRLSELRASRNLAGDSTKADAAVADAWRAADQTSQGLLSLVTPAGLQLALVPGSN